MLSKKAIFERHLGRGSEKEHFQFKGDLFIVFIAFKKYRFNFCPNYSSLKSF